MQQTQLFRPLLDLYLRSNTNPFAAPYSPGCPSDQRTTLGSLVSRVWISSEVASDKEPVDSGGSLFQKM